MVGIRDDMVEEARRLSDVAAANDLPLRLVGGLAIRLHDEHLPSALQRDYADIDLVTTSMGAKATATFLDQMGYTPNDRFNIMNGGRRQVFYDVERERQIDVFVGQFRMCHQIDLSARLDRDRLTVPLAELLLTKLQVVELNRKDVVDIAAIVYGHDVGEGDDEMVNSNHIARVLSGDWGFWRTVQGSIATTRGQLPTLDLTDDDRTRIEDRLSRLWERVEAQPKSLRWRGRAKLGERSRWYDEPEEIAHDRSGARA